MIFALPQLERVTKSNLYSVGFKSGFKFHAQRVVDLNFILEYHYKMLAVPMPLANGAKIGTLAIVLIALSFAAAEDRTRKAATDMHAPFID